MSLDADVNIILNAKDNASDVVNDAVKRINSSYRDMTRQQRSVGQAFELNNRRLFQTMRGIQTVGNMANRMVGIYQAWNIQQIRNADLARDLAEAQRDVNRSIVEFGIGSEEHVKAMEEEARLKQEIQNANFQTAFSYIFMATSIVGSVIPAIKKLVPHVRVLNRTMGEGVGAYKSPTAGLKQTIGPNKPKIGIGGKAALGGLGILGSLIAEDIMSSNDPAKRAQEIILDPFNFSGKNTDNKIIITVNVNGTIQEQTIDLSKPYVVE